MQERNIFLQNVLATEQDQLKLKWDLSSDMTEYVNYNFYFFIPEKNINDSVLHENPVSANI